MFFSTDVLRRGRTPLGRLWSAAFAKNLRKASVNRIDVLQSCDAVLDPEVPHALRLQAILTTGIVKVHEKKVTYLKEDAESVIQRLHRVVEAEPNEAREKGNIHKRSKITQDKWKPSDQVPDLLGGFDALDSEYGTGQGLQSLEDDDYFVVQFHENYESIGNDYGYDGADGYDYMMESPPEFLQEIEDAIIPHGNSWGVGYDHHDGSNDPRHRSGQGDYGVDQVRAQIVVRQRKRKRSARVDFEGTVDAEMVSLNVYNREHQQQNLMSRLGIQATKPEASGRWLVSILTPMSMSVGGAMIASTAEGCFLGGIVDRLFATKVPKVKNGRGRNGYRRNLGATGYDDGDGERNDQDVERYVREDMGMDMYDGNDTERGVELEQLRTALHLTPQNQNQFRFGHAGYSSNPTSNSMPGSIRSSVDLSREDSSLSLSNSVQKEKLSDLLLESHQELQNHGGTDDVRSGRRRSTRRGTDTWSQLDRFILQETGPSELQSNSDFLMFNSGSHTLDILTKARLCCHSWGRHEALDKKMQDEDRDFGLGNDMALPSMDIMSLDDITSHLSRQEAAKMFHHILVGVTAGIITTSQSQPYAPILVKFNSSMMI